MNKDDIINSVINSDVKIAKLVPVPDFKSNEEIAKFIEKLKPKDRINKTIFDNDTGEIYLDKNKSVTKYEIYSIPKILRGEKVLPKEDKGESDPRENFLNTADMQKYYNYKHKGGGTYIIYRSDKKPFKEYDEINISGFIDDIGDIDPNAYQYSYNSTIKDFEEGKRYYTISPEGIDKEYVVNNFENFYKVKSFKLKTFFDDYEEHKEAYDMYDPDADITQNIVKKDGSKMTKDDIQIIKAWLQTQDFGRAEVQLSAKEGERELKESNFIVSFPL